MRKMALAALMFSIFSIFGAGTALANCEYAWKGCTACPKGGNNYKASKFFFGSRCFVCSTVRCNGTGLRCSDDVENPPKEENLTEKIVAEKVDEILKDLSPEMIVLADGKEVALKMAEEHPHAASFVYSAYVISNTPEVGLPIKSTVWGEGNASEHLFSAFKVKEFINKHYNKMHINDGEYESKEKESRIRTDYEIRRTSDGAAYMNIEISTADADYRETGKILPNIRVNLRKDDNDKDERWMPINWQTY